MEKLKQKLSSRKLWVAIVGVVIGLAAAFGIEENDYAQVAGMVTSAVSVLGYIFGEAKVDAARQEYDASIVSDIVLACKEAEKDSTAE
jgi:spore maturation protein SpmB